MPSKRRLRRLRRQDAAKEALHNVTRKGKSFDQQLLPGISDHITAANIFPRLSWDTVQNLTTVSHGWLRAIRSGEVFEARVSSQSTHTMFVVRTDEVGVQAVKLALYSVEDNSLYSLPPIPVRCYTITYTSVNGKLYVIGSLAGVGDLGEMWPSFMYVYDLVRHIGWRRRAAPRFVSQPDECAVMNGKIFVCGGRQRWNFNCALYNPDVDTWSMMRDNKIYQNIIAGVQGDLDYQFKPIRGLHSCKNWIRHFPFDYFGACLPYFSSPLNRALGMGFGEKIVVTFGGGIFFKMTHESIDVFDSETNTWTPFPLQGSFEFNNNEETRIDMQEATGDFTYTGRGYVPSGRNVWTWRVAVVSVKNTIFSLVERLDPTSEYWQDDINTERVLHFMKCETTLSGNMDVLVQANKWQGNSQIQQNNTSVEWKEVKGNLPMPLPDEFLSCPLQL